RLSKHLGRKIREIINNADFDVLKIKRYEHASLGGAKSRYYTWQVRLFKKGGIEYFGLTHEKPMTHGVVKKLNPREDYINHIDELRHESFYNKMDIFSHHSPHVLISRDL